MGKYSKLNEMYTEERAFKKEQEKLHEKHSGIEQNTVILEKSGIPRATVSFIKSLGRVFFGIILILLAAIGVITLIYPELRENFWEVLKVTVNEVKLIN